MKKIGKYEIVEELGRGGMGVVYRAHDSVMEREVALKVILDAAMDVPEIKARFYREAQTAGKLTHENITIVHDVGEDQGRPYIVMEYLPGYDLRTVLERKKPLSLLQKLDIAVQIARGLAFSHSRDIIHRDIKPANIRIVDDRKVKIMDFGIAKPGSSTLTSTGAVIGTPYYMSPEQIQGKRVDKRADIFSYGVLLYELLTYFKPFTGNEPTAVMYKIVHEPPEHLDELDRGSPAALKVLASKLLEKNPDQRYQTLDHVVEELETIIGELKREDTKRFQEQRKRFEKLVSDARTFLTKRRFQDAYRAVEQAAAIDPASSQLGRVRDEIRLAEAEESKRAAVAEKVALAKRYINGKHFTDAIEVAKEIQKLEPKSPEGTQLLRTANEGLAAHWLSEAQSFLKKGDLKNAEWLAEKILGLAPDHPAARELLRSIKAQQVSQETRVTPLQAEMTITAEAHPPVVEPGPSPAPPPPAKAKPRRKVFVGAGVLLVVAAVAVYMLFLAEPGPPVGYVALNVLPWAEVTKIEAKPGGTVPLSEKSITPCRISLPEGTYTIQLTNPGYSQPLAVTVTVKAGEIQEVRKQMPGFDLESVLSSF